MKRYKGQCEAILGPPWPINGADTYASYDLLLLREIVTFRHLLYLVESHHFVLVEGGGEGG
ncbi:hypothetical protein Tco_1158920, partial [Tanacetum coccineum]